MKANDGGECWYGASDGSLIAGGQVAYGIHIAIRCYLCNWNAAERRATLASEACNWHLVLLHLVFH